MKLFSLVDDPDWSFCFVDILSKEIVATGNENKILKKKWNKNVKLIKKRLILINKDYLFILN